MRPNLKTGRSFGTHISDTCRPVAPSGLCAYPKAFPVKNSTCPDVPAFRLDETIHPVEMTGKQVGPKGCINLEPCVAWQRSFRSVQSPDRQLGHESSPSVGGLKLCDIGPLDKSVHPAQLVTRYSTLYHFYAAHAPAMEARLKNYESAAETAVVMQRQFDDASTVRGLRSFLQRARDCRAI